MARRTGSDLRHLSPAFGDKRKSFRLFGGSMGRLYLRLLPFINPGPCRSFPQGISARSTMGFCRNPLWRGLTAHLVTPRIVSIQRPYGEEWKLFWRHREIGCLPPGESAWKIQKTLPVRYRRSHASTAGYLMTGTAARPQDSFERSSSPPPT